MGDEALARGCVDLVVGGHLHLQSGPTAVTGENGALGYSYTTGTVLTAMLDLRNPDTTNGTVPVIWLGALNGVISAPSSIETRIVQGLDQAFEQSPYLRK